MSDCIFCKIISGKISSPRVAEDDSFICIRDLHPQAPVHLLMIPKAHVSSLDAAAAATDAEANLGRLLLFAAATAKKMGLVEGGYRTVINTGAGGGQTVFHLHVHVLGGGALQTSFA